MSMRTALGRGLYRCMQGSRKMKLELLVSRTRHFIVILLLVILSLGATLWMITTLSMDSRHLNCGENRRDAHPSEATLSREEQIAQRLKYYSSMIFKADSKSLKENCTLVMLTYKRNNILPKILMHYCRVPQLQRIVVVWNDIDTPIPPNITNITATCDADLKLIVAKKNKLTNRYIPREEVNTDCKFC